MDNISQQSDEIEALKSIYGEEWRSETVPGTYSIDISKDVRLYITLVPEYPSSSLPKYELLAPNLTFNQKKFIQQKFHNLYESEGGGPLIYQMIMITEDVVKKSDSKNVPSSTTKPCVEEGLVINNSKNYSHLKVIHGPTVIDRKSVFQGHVCEVKCKEDISGFMELLLDNRKIAQATHNISAYRILQSNNVVMQDCDDDGENKASSRLLDLLQTLKLNNVMVVVSRWYGGIQLGPDRFRHINNAARQALVEAGFVKT
ncbi:protein IMPACT homolog [Diorhabda carinulata]|uniref:protein IMPACT homolog n=1 Tax=Diorhabda carinulata TaxID=1163345 RepID=UPI0025A0B06C|nr:protein IMPACT homolog [Diorhabda carinulata]